MRVLASENVLQTSCTILERLGVSTQHAHTQASHLLEADLRGHPSHGVQRLPVLAERLTKGLLHAGAVPRIDEHTAAVFSVRGDRALGPVAAKAALDELQRRSEHTGVGMAALADCGHLGMLAPYVEQLAQAGFIGIAFSTSEALVHPMGGKRALLGTNPWAIGIPLTPEPFVFDMATSAISMGEVLARWARGVPLAPGSAVDADGEPTTDPASAVNGALSPFGGYKGFGLGLAIELMVPLITGTSIGTDITGTLDTEHLSTKGDVFIAIQPTVFGKDSAARVTDYVRLMRSEVAQGGAMLPGDRSRLLKANRLRTGVPIADETWSKMEALLGLSGAEMTS